MVLSVVFLDKAEPVGCNLNYVGKVAVNLFHFLFHASYCFVCLVLAETGYALHLDFKQAQDVFLGHLSHHLWIEWC